MPLNTRGDHLMGGRYLVLQEPEPVHTCGLPASSEPGDVWLCDCGRMYCYTNSDGYGFGWHKVFFTYWLRRLAARIGGRAESFL